MREFAELAIMGAAGLAGAVPVILAGLGYRWIALSAAGCTLLAALLLRPDLVMYYFV